jgi:hypothetical protein
MNATASDQLSGDLEASACGKIGQEMGEAIGDIDPDDIENELLLQIRPI